MPAVEIDSPEQYSKALALLTEVGGTFQGVCEEEKRCLLVTEAQYRALLAAGVVKKGRLERAEPWQEKSPAGRSGLRNCWPS